jgi:hypothetical protein
MFCVCVWWVCVCRGGGGAGRERERLSDRHNKASGSRFFEICSSDCDFPKPTLHIPTYHIHIPIQYTLSAVLVLILQLTISGNCVGWGVAI